LSIDRPVIYHLRVRVARLGGVYESVSPHAVVEYARPAPHYEALTVGGLPGKPQTRREVAQRDMA
jgi:hypothetical protein